jgi:hypothetical protein
MRKFQFLFASLAGALTFVVLLAQPAAAGLNWNHDDTLVRI